MAFAWAALVRRGGDCDTHIGSWPSSRRAGWRVRLRGALVAIPSGQREACRALGLPTSITYLKVLVPQAMNRAILPFGNLMVDLVKGTSLLSAITVTELAFAGRQEVAALGHPFIIFGVVLLLYLCMTSVVAGAASVLDSRMRGWQRKGTRA